MGNPKAFLTIPRKEAGYRPIHDRILDFSEVEQTLNFELYDMLHRVIALDTNHKVQCSKFKVQS